MKESLMLVCLFILFSKGSALTNASEFSANDRKIKIMNTVYSGNPKSESLATYVYLCRKSGGSYNYNGFSGLSVAFITVDLEKEENREFTGFDPVEKNEDGSTNQNMTRSIVWSANVNFGGNYKFGYDYRSTLKIEYVYNYESYRNSDENFGEDGALLDNDEYLHREDGVSCLKQVDYFCYDNNRLKSRVAKTLESAIFRWKTDGRKLSEVLVEMGKIGKNKEFKKEAQPNKKIERKVIPRYEPTGSYGINLEPFDNCATFSAKVISKIVGIDIPRKSFLSELKLVGACGLVGIAGLGTSLGMSLLLPGLGPTLAITALTAAGNGFLIKSAAQPSTPNRVINSVCKLYNGMSETTNFKIVAHDDEEIRERMPEIQGEEDVLVPYKNFELKGIKEATAHKLEMGKLGGSRTEDDNERLDKIFLKSDFN